MVLSFMRLLLEFSRKRRTYFMERQEVQIWNVWITSVGSSGLSFARGRLGSTDVLLVHAAPETLDVEVYDLRGALCARGQNLTRTAQSPMARLRIEGKNITREDCWPTEADYGTPVLLAGGEVGILRSWWNDAQHRQWRWNIELSNHN
jgi:hypothetical protein